jgi:hypothetical protein
MSRCEKPDNFEDSWLINRNIDLFPITPQKITSKRKARRDSTSTQQLLEDYLYVIQATDHRRLPLLVPVCSLLPVAVVFYSCPHGLSYDARLNY